MYLLLFEAWATLLGFARTTVITWNGWTQATPSGGTISSYGLLANQLVLQNDSATNALILSHLMTHVSMILIFVFVIMFFVFLFRLVSGMLSGRR